MILWKLVALVIALDAAESTFVSKCVKALADSHFRNRTISVFYSSEDSDADEPSKFGLNDKENGLDSSLTALMMAWPVLIYSDKATAVPAYEQKRSPHEAVLIFLMHATTFKHIVRVIKTTRVMGSDTKVIVSFKDDIEINVSETLEYIWSQLRAINLYVAVYNDSAISFFDIVFVENEPYSQLKSTFLQPRECRHVSFPDKTKELVANSFLKIISEHGDEPYIFMNPRSQEADGACPRALQLIVKHLSTKVEVELYGTYGYVYDEDDFSGFLGMLYRFEADLLCGNCLMYQERLDGFEVTSLFQQEAYEVIMVKPPAIASGATLTGLVAEFSVPVWICSCVVFISVAIILHLNNLLSNSQQGFFHVVIDVFGSIFGNNSSGLTKIFRSFVWILFLYNIVITASYTSGLIGHFTVPRQGVLFKTRDEADDAGVIFYNDIGNLGERLRFVESNHQTYYAKVMRKNADMWILKDFTESDQTNIFYFFDKPMRGPEPNYWFMPPAHPLFPKVNYYMGLITQAGLLDHWMREIYLEELLASVYGTGHSAQSEKNKKITLEHIFGIFVLYGICIIVSFIVFVFEVISQVLSYCCSKKIV